MQLSVSYTIAKDLVEPLLEGILRFHVRIMEYHLIIY